MVEKYYNEKNELGVLISPGWGSEWSVYNCKELAYDKRIVEKWKNEHPSAKEMYEFLISLGYDESHVSSAMYGYDDLELKFIPKGTMFCITACDGNESIETPESTCMMIA